MGNQSKSFGGFFITIKTYATPLLVAFIGVLLFSYVGWHMESEEKESFKQKFEKVAFERSRAIQWGVHRAMRDFKYIKEFYKGSKYVDRKEFKSFTSDMVKGYLGLELLIWAPMMVEGNKPASFPIHFVEPQESNENVIGIDLMANDSDRELINRARDSGEMISSERIVLNKEINTYGFRVYYPIYLNKKPIQTVDQRRENLHGFLVGTYRLDPLISASVSHLASKGVYFWIQDKTAPEEKQLLYFDSGGVSVTNRGRAYPSYDHLENTVSLMVSFHVAGRKWLFTSIPSPEYLEVEYHDVSRVIFFSGLLFIFLLTVYLIWMRKVDLERASLMKTLQKEIIQRSEAESKIRDEIESRKVIGKVIETAFDPMSLKEQLEHTLDVIFSLPWFSLYPKGSIFIADSETGELVLTAHRNFSDYLLKACHRIQPGYCLCGKSFQTGEIVFSPHVDEKHDISYDGMPPHGHYIVPIKKRDKVLGVINLYVADGHIPRPGEEAFLVSIADTVLGLMERRKMEGRIKQQAEFDSLTGLPNRALFQDRMSQAILQANRSKGEVVLMFLDLDRFKLVNDTMGHDAGDELLIEASRRLVGCVRGSDTIARLGGDEFTVILTQLTNILYVELVVRRILEELEQPFLLTKGEASVSASIGITVYPNDSENLDELMRHADTAMYQAKKGGRSTYRFFTESMNLEAQKCIDMERALKRALEQEEFQVYYQPKVNPKTHEIMGMEALIRWIKPGNIMVSPIEFIPLAEETGLIIPIGAWVLKTACQQTQSWFLGLDHRFGH